MKECEIADYTYGEIAEILHVPLALVRSLGRRHKIPSDWRGVLAAAVLIELKTWFTPNRKKPSDYFPDPLTWIVDRIDQRSEYFETTENPPLTIQIYATDDLPACFFSSEGSWKVPTVNATSLVVNLQWIKRLTLARISAYETQKNQENSLVL